MKKPQVAAFFMLLFDEILEPFPAIRFKSSGSCAALRAFHCYPGYGVPIRVYPSLTDFFKNQNQCSGHAALVQWLDFFLDCPSISKQTGQCHFDSIGPCYNQKFATAL
ncbi:MAG: hypothetical protein RLY35_64 [Bacteroidota bacterium]